MYPGCFSSSTLSCSVLRFVGLLITQLSSSLNDSFAQTAFAYLVTGLGVVVETAVLGGVS